MHRTSSAIVGTSALLALFSLPAAAQSFSTVAREGDTVTGVGVITTTSTVAINDGASYLVEVDTDNSDTTIDGALINSVGLFLQEGQPLALPVGANLGGFDAINLNIAGNSCWNFSLDNTAGSSFDTGVYFGTNLLIQESDISTAPQFTAGTPYIGFFEVKINGAGDALVMASIDDPAITSTVDRALVVLDLDGSGNLISENVFLKEGDAPAALLGDTITDFETGPHNFDFNDSGLIAYIVDCTSAFGGDNALFRGSEMIAREGDPSPIPGRNWGTLSGISISLNNDGTLLWRGDLDGSTTDDNLLMLTNVDGTSQVLAREGQTVSTGIGPFKIASFGTTAPLFIGDDGDIFHFIDLESAAPSANDGLLVYNGRIIVQEGLTMVGADTVDSLLGVTDGFSMSPSGEYLIFRGNFPGAIQMAVAVDMTVGTPETTFCDDRDGALAACPCANPGSPTSGCDIAQGTGGVHLSLLTVQTSPTNRATMVGNGFPTSATPAAVVIRAPALDGASPVTFGDGLRCIGVPLVRLGATLAADGTSRHTFGHGAGAGPGTFYYQAWFRNTPISYCDPAAAFNLSNGHTINW